jgi:hypothetical protein
LVDVAERVISTFLQAFLAALLATSPGGTKSHVDWLNAALIGLFAALVSLATWLLTFVQSLQEQFAKPYFDLVYRTVLTFLQTFVGLLVAAGVRSALTFDWDTALRTSLIAAAGALLKGLSGIHVRGTIGASTFVKVPNQ